MLTSVIPDGGRRGVQQQFHIRISLVAHLETGGTATIAVIESNPIVVRGRNPGNFIHEQASASSASLILPKTDPYKPKTGYMDRLSTLASRKSKTKQESETELKLSDPRFVMHDYAITAPAAPNIYETHNWLSFDQEEQTMHGHGRTTRFGRSPPSTTSPTYSSSYPTTSSRISPQSQTTPAHLILAQNTSHDTDYVSTSTKISPISHDSYQSPSSRSLPPIRVEPKSDTAENSEPLYEYFPLGLNGWMPPVDAVYRPHVAHNTVLVPELKGLMIK